MAKDLRWCQKIRNQGNIQGKNLKSRHRQWLSEQGYNTTENESKN
jgi:hypothetical protein